MTISTRKPSEGEGAWKSHQSKAHAITSVSSKRSKVSCARGAIRRKAIGSTFSCTLVEAWEAKHYPLDLPDPIEAIKYHMEQKGLSAPDLIPFVGGRNRVYEVLARKRPLTLKMIQRLHKGLGIPAESLIKGIQRQAA